MRTGKTNSHFYYSGLSFYNSQAKALAPNTAASASFRSENINLILPFHKGSKLLSMFSRIGFIIKSPAFDKPPKRTIASGALKATKSVKKWQKLKG
jgi:hypothetical protein